MGYRLEEVLAHIRAGDVVMDDYVVFASVCRVVRVTKDVEVLGIVCVCHTRVHIPKYVIVSTYAMHPIDYFILQHILLFTSARVYGIPAIGMRNTTEDKLRKFVKQIKDYLHDHQERPAMYPKGAMWQ